MLLSLPRSAAAAITIGLAITFALALYLFSGPRQIGEPDYSKQGWVDLPDVWPRPVSITPSGIGPPIEQSTWAPLLWETESTALPASTSATQTAVLGGFVTSTTAGALATTGTLNLLDDDVPYGTSHPTAPAVVGDLLDELRASTTSGTSSSSSALGTLTHPSSTSHALNVPSASHVTSAAGLVGEISDAAPCQSLPGGEDIVVVMRTGATEIKDKLPVHLDTTFQCYPNSIIFSDFAETFQDHEVYDVLVDIDEDIKLTNSDFEHYQHILQVGRTGLDASELSGTSSTGSGPSGNNENAGWRLDKWKFLPMINKTLDLYPDKKWYVFVEPDSYPVWSNLVQWLQQHDAKEPLYFGSAVMIGDDLFAHGGSVFVISQPAMVKGVEEYKKHAARWHDWTAHHWAGDCVLGKALHDAGVELTWTNPMTQGGNPFTMDYGLGRNEEHPLWCSPALSYHHLQAKEVEKMWRFEQGWIRSTRAVGVHTDSSILHHRQTFLDLVKPSLVSHRDDWNNDVDYEQDNVQEANFSYCLELCEGIPECVQFSVRPDGCAMGSEPKLGRAMDGGYQSGWLPQRIERWIGELGTCEGKEGWLA